MIYSLYWEGTFDAAHYLPNYEGKCANLHGHTWKVEIRIDMSTLPADDGMIIDFTELKKIISMFDHRILNVCPKHLDTVLRGTQPFLWGFFDNPTAENIAKEIHLIVKKKLKEIYDSFYRVQVKLYESEHSYAEVSD